MLKSLKSRHFAEPSRILPQQRIDAVGMPLPADTLATANDDDVYIPDTILWDLAGGNSPHRPLFETVSATARATKAKTDDGDDLPDMIFWTSMLATSPLKGRAAYLTSLCATITTTALLVMMITISPISSSRTSSAMAL